jgi:hypothetical protein
MRTAHRRTVVLLAFGLLAALGLRFIVAAPDSRQDARSPQAVAHVDAASSASGIYVMRPAPPVERPARTVGSARPVAGPQLPFSFLGKVTEDGERVVLLHANGQAYKIRHAGPLDERYVVDEIYDDRILIRDLQLDERHVVELDAREYAIPGGLRGEYPPD